MQCKSRRRYALMTGSIGAPPLLPSLASHAWQEGRHREAGVCCPADLWFRLVTRDGVWTFYTLCLLSLDTFKACFQSSGSMHYIYALPSDAKGRRL